MSKSGLYAQFGSKQELQLASVEEAGMPRSPAALRSDDRHAE
jgi:hypothetical protein